DDVRMMFHEPYYPFTVWPLRRNVLAVVNRIMAVLLLSDARVAYVSTMDWHRRLNIYAPRALRFVWMPIPAPVSPARDATRIAEWRSTIAPDASHRVVGHFGTYGALVSRFLRPTLELLLQERPSTRICLIGARSEEFASQLCRENIEWRARITATGRLASDEVSACLSTCDVVVQPYADGASGRRTTLMAALINGVAAVTNRGAATERDWITSDAVEFATRSTPRALRDAVYRVLDNDGRRAMLAASGRALYDRRFAMAHTIEALTADRGRAS
ncbi:MAG TPA: glycosyltransferase, partial [Gemmatimonadaceae bacterium]